MSREAALAALSLRPTMDSDAAVFESEGVGAEVVEAVAFQISMGVSFGINFDLIKGVAIFLAYLWSFHHIWQKGNHDSMTKLPSQYGRTTTQVRHRSPALACSHWLY